jgi:hypothetical protein
MERKMNFLRGTCLLLTITLVSLAAPAFAQQEVDPDHFDQVASTKPAVKAPISKSTAQKRVHGKTSAANHRAKSQSSKRPA